ncbi:MAG: imidazole glycerol phosphate synthase subunit HisH [Chloroflexota bacterium]|nr:imidazole glycerol phosphate synthase subunit HisH [Dehalococcoidia bacterium]MDW8255107.1 imidazole glycerol phosphate synthase subunit HisH [Chloroflexota bacterium]
MIAVVNYGAGNLRSVAKALEKVGAPIVVTSDPSEVERADAVILPGVGAAADTMSGLREAGLVAPLRAAVKAGKPFFGVCIGLQVLLTVSDENGGAACLDIVPGRVRRLPAGLKVPHMGWNEVVLKARHPLFDGIPNGSYFYFVHSYYADPDDPAVVLGETEYGIRFPAVLAAENLVATQFHPEKSGPLGLRLYENFCRLAGQR